MFAQNKKQRIKGYIKESKEEVKLFNKTGKIIYLEQASEKIYNAFILLLELIYKKNITSHTQVYEYTEKSSETIQELGLIADALHKYFYESGSEFFMKRNLQKAWILFGRLKNYWGE